MEDGSVSGASFKAKSTQQPDPSAYSGDVLWIIFTKIQVLFRAQGSAQLENSINSVILQVAFIRVGAENRSAMWHALNLPGLLIWFSSNSSLNLAWKFSLLCYLKPALGSQGPAFQPCLCHVPAVWPWKSLLAYPSLIFSSWPHSNLNQWSTFHLAVQTTNFRVILVFSLSYH